jgi:hypothetical protein
MVEERAVPLRNNISRRFKTRKQNRNRGKERKEELNLRK